MDEYQLLNLMNLSFVSNAMYFVGMVLFIWLGFRFANAIYEDGSAPMISKVLSSLYYLCVAGFFYFNGQVAGGILDTYSALLIDIVALDLPHIPKIHLVQERLLVYFSLF